MTTSNARMASGSPETFPPPCARPTRARARQKSSKSCAGDAQHAVDAIRRDSDKRRTLDAIMTQARRWPRAVAAAARARIWEESRSAAAARDASRFRRHRRKARVRAFVLFERRQLTKFTRAESWRVLDMAFLEDGILSRASRDTFFCRLTFLGLSFQ